MWRSIKDSADIAAGLARLYRSEFWSEDEIREYQAQALVEQLRYAAATIPYYRGLGLDPDEIVNSSALQSFPALSKAIIQDQGERLCNRVIIADSPFRSTTSGSSGEPTTTWFDRKSWNFCKYALKIRRTLEGGAPWLQRQLLFDESANPDGSITPPARRRLGSFQQVRLSVFTPVEQQLELLLELKPNVIYGTPSGIKELCDYASCEDVPLPPVATIFLSSELITDAVRDQLTATLHGRVIGIYGSTEFKDLAHQCEHGRYHLYFHSAYIESKPQDGQPSGRLQITSLINKAMPLIRFDIGDYAEIGYGRCACGRSSPYLHNIIGREIEFLELPDGARISPYRLTTAVEKTPGLLKYRFVQEHDLSLRMEVVFGNHEMPRNQRIALIQENVRAALGNAIDLPVCPVDRIDRSRGGKHSIVAHPARDGTACPTKLS